MNLEESLKTLSKTIFSEESQLKLQKLLTDDHTLSDLQSPKTHEILKEISSSLTKSLLESKLYHMINSELSNSDPSNTQSLNKSVLDLSGRFIWSDKSFEHFFKVSVLDLKSTSLFSLMSPSSLRYLYSKFSSELFAKHSKIVISYSLTNGMELTSRCTKVVYSNGPGCYQVGVFMQTRACGHRIQCYGPSWVLSPMYGHENLLFTPLQITPSIVGQGNELSMMDLENLRITPFLKADSPYKKRKIEEWFVTDFRND